MIRCTDQRRLWLSLALAFIPHVLHGQCLLVVNQPTATPTLTRSSGNQVSGSASLQTTQKVQGDWVVYLTAHLNFRSGGGSWSEVAISTGTAQIYNGTVQAAFGSGTATAALEPRGNGDYQITLTAYGICNTTNVPLTPPNATPSPIVTVTRPTITSNGILGMWWFGSVGKEDAANGYYNSVAITGNSNSQWTLSYNISQGTDKVKLTCTGCNNTVAQAKAPSGGCTRDVVISASVTGFSAAAFVTLAVNRPAGRSPSSIYNNGPVNNGYWSKDYFTFTDRCILSMPSVAYHETFPGAYLSFWPGGAGTYWTTAPAAAGNAAYRYDAYTTYDDIISDCED